MDIDKATRHAVNLMYLHGITPEWGFKFHNAKKKQGNADFLTKVISVNRAFALEKDEKWLTQVMLHEIAHAKAGYSASHGPVWRRIASDIGYVHTDELVFAKGERVMLDIPGHERHGLMGTIVKVNSVNVHVDLDNGQKVNAGKSLLKSLDTAL